MAALGYGVVGWPIFQRGRLMQKRVRVTVQRGLLSSERKRPNVVGPVPQPHQRADDSARCARHTTIGAKCWGKPQFNY